MKNVLFKTETPIFQNKLFKKKEDALNYPSGKVEIVWNPDNYCFVNQSFEEINDQYDHFYNNDQSGSLAFQNHIENILCLIQDRYSKDISVVEIGCGNGYFIQALSQAGFQNIKGFDTVYSGDDTRISNRFVDDFSVIEADLVILRHTLEHIKNPKEMLFQISKIRGVTRTPEVYIEVPNLEWILDNKSFYDLFYEHVNYFKDYSFQTIFQAPIIHHTLSGQYLSVFASLQDLSTSNDVDSNLLARDIERLRALQHKKNEVIANLISKRIAIWGAGAKGSVLGFYLKRILFQQVVIIDTNIQKQGLFPCGLDKQVLSPDEFICNYKPDELIIIVMNPVYIEEIRKTVGSEYKLLSITDI